MLLKIRLARPVEYIHAPGTGEGHCRRKWHVQHELPERGIKFFAKLRPGERGWFRPAIADIAGLRVRGVIAYYWNRHRRQKTVSK